MSRPFCKLANPEQYVACPWDLAADAAGRDYWCGLFRRSMETILRLGVPAAVVRGVDHHDAADRARRCTQEFDACLNEFCRDPQNCGRVDIITLDRWRDGILRRHGFVDPMVDLKERENEKMLPLLPQVCRELDAQSGGDALRAVIEGVFAGNIFDMGCDATAQRFESGSPDFLQTRQSLPKRPWLIDDYDAFAGRMLEGPIHRKAVLFIDNAGSDFLLGALPMIRWLAGRGTNVILAANERPTLNDMTIHDVNRWWPRILEVEPSFADLPIQRVSTGTGEPLIDLGDVSDELNAAAADTDLVILEGMGRGVESNLDAQFICDAVNLAMIKDQAVAARHRGKLYDVVCRFRAPASSACGRGRG